MGVARQMTAQYGNHIGISILQDAVAPRGQLRHVRRIQFPGRQAVQYMVGINHLDCRHVGIGDGANFQLGRQATRTMPAAFIRFPAWAATASPKAANRAR